MRAIAIVLALAAGNVLAQVVAPATVPSAPIAPAAVGGAWAPAPAAPPIRYNEPREARYAAQPSMNSGGGATPVRCVDKDGRVSYSDKACKYGAPVISAQIVPAREGRSMIYGEINRSQQVVSPKYEAEETVCAISWLLMKRDVETQIRTGREGAYGRHMGASISQQGCDRFGYGVPSDAKGLAIGGWKAMTAICKLRNESVVARIGSEVSTIFMRTSGRQMSLDFKALDLDVNCAAFERRYPSATALEKAYLQSLR